MKRKAKKLLSLLLCFTMVLQSLPVTSLSVRAEENAFDCKVVPEGAGKVTSEKVGEESIKFEASANTTDASVNTVKYTFREYTYEHGDDSEQSVNNPLTLPREGLSDVKAYFDYNFYDSVGRVITVHFEGEGSLKLKELPDQDEAEKQYRVEEINPEDGYVFRGFILPQGVEYDSKTGILSVLNETVPANKKFEITANFEEGYSLVVGGTEVDEDTTEGTGWSYDPETKTLTLNNFTYKSGEKDTAIFYKDVEGSRLTIVLDGENTVSGCGVGISSNTADVEITGEGDLEISDCGVGIVAVNGDITISGSGDLKISGKSPVDTYGISANGGNVTINGKGVVEITGIYHGINANGGAFTFGDKESLKMTKVTQGIFSTKDITFESEGKVEIASDLLSIVSGTGADISFNRGTVSASSVSDFSVRSGGKIIIATGAKLIAENTSKHMLAMFASVSLNNAIAGTGWDDEGNIGDIQKYFGSVVPEDPYYSYPYVKVQFPPAHKHSFTYKVSTGGDAIEASCNNTTDCDLEDEGYKVTLKIKQPEHEKYGDKKAAAATLEGKDEFAKATKATIGDIQYYQQIGGGDDDNDWHLLGTTAPEDVAGSYKAEIEVTVNENDQNVTRKLAAKYTIQPDITYPSAKDLTYNGKPQGLVSGGSINGGLTNGVKFQYKIEGESDYSDNIPEKTNAGEYTVKYRITSENVPYGITLSSNETVPDVKIKKAKLTVSANKEVIYTGAAVANNTITAEVNGYVNETDATHGVTLTYGTHYTIACDNQGAVGEYTTVITKGEDVNPLPANYELEYVNGKLTIKEAALEFETEPAKEEGLVYNGTEQKLVTAGTLKTTGDVMYVLGRHDREAPKTGWSKDIPVGKDAKTYYVWYKAAIHGNDANHKDSDPVCIIVPIAKKDVKVTIADKTRVYGDEDPELTATVTGMADGEELEYTLSREEGSAVGEYTISANYTATNNYEVEVKNGKFTIDRANVVVSVNAVSKNYGDKDPGFTAEVTGLKSGDNESVIAYNISRIKGENIGEYQIIARGAETQGNYNVTYIPANLTINPAPVVVKAEDLSKLYGAPDPELTWKATGLKNGDTEDILTVHIAREQGNAAGEYPIVVTGDKEQGNYSITFVDGKFTIMPADVTIIEPVANELTFDGEAHDLVKAGSVSEGKIQYAVSTNATSAPEDEESWSDEVPQRTDAGTYHVWYRVVDNPNFNPVDPDHVDVTIAKKAVTITADKATKIYGEKDPYFTAVVEGTVGEDTIEYTVSRVEITQNAGVYTDDIRPVVSGTYNNYEITCIAADYTIMQAEVTVTAANKTKVYGNADPEFTWTVTGLKYSDTKSVITANPKRVANDNNNVGKHDIVFDDETNQDNYKVTFVKGTLTIDPAAVVITPVDKTKVYGDEDPELEWTVAGLKYNETEEVIAGNVSIVREEGEDVGEYSIVVSGAKTYGNYSFSYGRAAKLTITQKVVKVNSVGTVAKTYDGSKFIAFSDEYATITDLKGRSLDDELSVYVTAEYDDANSYAVNGWYTKKTVSINSMTLSGNKAANYSISVNDSQKTTTGYITRAYVTVSACSTSKEYGQVDPELKFTCEGLMDVDKNEDGSIKDGVFTGRLTRTAGEEVGDDYVILKGTLDSQNYNITFKQGTFKILVSTIDPSVSVQGWTYGGYNEEVNSPKVTGNFGNGVETYYYYPVADEGEDVPAADEMLEGIPAGDVELIEEDEEEVQGTEWDDKEVAKLPAGDYCVYAHVSDKTASGNSTSYNAATTAPFRFTVSKKLIGVEWTDTTLTYNGTAQKPVATATGTVSNDEIQIEVSGEEINVGTYLAVASGITGERAGSYELLDDTTIFNIKKAVVTVSADALSKTYGEADPELTVSINGVIGEDVIDYEVSREAGESAGRYNILVIAGENPNYDVKTTGAKLVINKAVAAVSVVPAAKILVYDGQAQELVEEGRTNDGIMYYAVTETNAAPASYAFKANVPTATEDGTYYVWYMVKGDADHSDMVAEESIEVKIEACAAVEKKPVAVRDLTESYEDQALIGEGTASGGKMLYALGESADVAPETGWTTEVPKAKAPGIYYVWYYVEDEKGLKDTAAECVTVVVAVNEKIKAERAISSNLATIEDTVSIVPDAAGKVWTLDASANDASSNELTVKATFVVGAKITLAGYDKQATKQFRDFNKTSKKTATISKKGVLKTKKAGTGVLKYVMAGGRVVTLDYTVVKPAVTVEKGLNISVSANAPGEATRLNATYSGAGTYDVKITGVPLNSLYTFKGRTPLSKDNIVIGKDGEIHVTGVVAAKNSSKIIINAQGKKYTVKVMGKFK